MSRRSIAFLTVLAAVCLVAGPVLAQAPMGLKVTDITALIREFKAVDVDQNLKLSHSELSQRFQWPVPPSVVHDAPAHGAAAGLGFTRSGLFSLLANFRVIDANRDGVLQHGELVSFLHPGSELQTGRAGDACATCPVARELTCRKAPTCEGAVRCAGDPEVVCHKAPTCKGAVHCGKARAKGYGKRSVKSWGKTRDERRGSARRHHRHSRTFRWHRHPGSACQSVAEQTVVK
jgi:hypothetical protein